MPRRERTGWTGFGHCRIAGLPIVTASRTELADAMAADCLAARAEPGRRRPRLVFSANGHALSLRARDPAFRDALDRADIVHADGGWLVTLSRLLTDAPIAERSSTTDMMRDLAARAAERGLTFYLLGAPERVNAACARRLEADHPGLRVVGRHHGYFAPEEEAEIVAAIDRARPDVLWVALGKPREQLFALRWRDGIDAGWLVSCGGCFNFVAGDYRRAPRWMREANLEWLYRMASDPRRLAWRYLTTNPHALWLALTQTRRGGG